MIIREQRAAIYVKDAQLSTRKGEVSGEQLLELSRRYCAMRGYQLCEEHIYQANGKPLSSNDPQMSCLRMAAFQREFDALVVPSLGSIGLLPPWMSIPSSLAIDGFYECGVRVESVIPRNGTHDVRQQMLLEAINFVKWSMQKFPQRKIQHSKLQKEEQQ